MANWLNKQELQVTAIGNLLCHPHRRGATALVLQFARQSGRGNVPRAKKLKKKCGIGKILFECMIGKQESAEYKEDSLQHLFTAKI